MALVGDQWWKRAAFVLTQPAVKIEGEKRVKTRLPEKVLT